MPFPLSWLTSYMMTSENAYGCFKLGKTNVMYILNHTGQCRVALLSTRSFKKLSAISGKIVYKKFSHLMSKKYLANNRCFLLLILFGHVENMFY